VLRGTGLLERYEAGELRLLEREEYLETLECLLEHLHPEIVVQRLTGERERALFVAPRWALAKTSLLNDLRARMGRHGAFQGRLWCAAPG
jgi:radical SAM superfamily enzyme